MHLLLFWLCKFTIYFFILHEFNVQLSKFIEYKHQPLILLFEIVYAGVLCSILNEIWITISSSKWAPRARHVLLGNNFCSFIHSSTILKSKGVFQDFRLSRKLTCRPQFLNEGKLLCCDSKKVDETHWNLKRFWYLLNTWYFLSGLCAYRSF